MPLTAFRRDFRAFLHSTVLPAQQARRFGEPFPSAAWEEAGSRGFLGLATPVEFGGRGLPDFAYSLVVIEEVVAAGTSGFAISLQNDIIIPFVTALGTQEQRGRWLPGLCGGTRRGAIALTEEQAGSDLSGIATRAEKVDGGFLLNGEKYFIANGATQNFLLLLARTADGPMGLTLFVVDGEANQAIRRTPIDKIGLKAQDTARLSLENIFVPDQAVLGVHGRAAGHLMRMLPLERLAIAARANAGARRCLDLTKEHVTCRRAYGGVLADLQSVRLAVADMYADVCANEALVERCVRAHNRGELLSEDAAMAKLRASETFRLVTDRCLHLFGAKGFEVGHPVSELFLDSRGSTLQGGASEVMREIVASAQGLRVPPAVARKDG
jgi:alkylation response protein AidB-like acyl-CoA dehydrogenase